MKGGIHNENLMSFIMGRLIRNQNLSTKSGQIQKERTAVVDSDRLSRLIVKWMKRIDKVF